MAPRAPPGRVDGDVPGYNTDRKTPDHASLVKMTRNTLPAPKSARQRATQQAGVWRLQDAKAQFSEVVRRAKHGGPQHVTVHGREAVVVIAAEDFRRLQGLHSGQSLIDAMRASPHRDVEIAPGRASMPVRDVEL